MVICRCASSGADKGAAPLDLAARKLLEARGVSFEYLEYGSYLSSVEQRLERSSKANNRRNGEARDYRLRWHVARHINSRRLKADLLMRLA